MEHLHILRGTVRLARVGRYGSGKPSEHYCWIIAGEKRRKIQADFAAYCAPVITLDPETGAECVTIGPEPSPLPRQPNAGEEVVFTHQVERLPGNVSTILRRATGWTLASDLKALRAELEATPLWRAVIVFKQHDDPVDDGYAFVRWQGRTWESFEASGLTAWTGLTQRPADFSGDASLRHVWIKLQRRIPGGWVSWPINGIRRVLPRLSRKTFTQSRAALPCAS